VFFLVLPFVWSNWWRGFSKKHTSLTSIGMEGMMSEGDAKKAAREWAREVAHVHYLLPHPGHGQSSLADLIAGKLPAFLREREAVVWKAGAKAMREKAAVQLGDVLLDRGVFAGVIRALPIPEPGRCGCNGDYPCDGAHR
jgi:hypothetical protein